jgi:uncharacterized integral membrane protein (TIGR00697 family)
MDLRHRLFLYLTATFVTALVVADIIGGKFALVGGVPVSVGMIPFPVTFVLTDLINEYWGKQGARRVTFVGLAMAAFAFVVILVSRLLPVSPRSPLPQPVFDQVFGLSNRLYVASLTAYVVGQLSDIYVFNLIKRVTAGKLLWLRATGSTVISQAIDTLVVNFVLLWGSTLADGSHADLRYILQIAATGYGIKFVIAVALTPLIYAGHGVMHRRFGLTPMPADPATSAP